MRPAWNQSFGSWNPCITHKPVDRGGVFPFLLRSNGPAWQSASWGIIPYFGDGWVTGLGDSDACGFPFRFVDYITSKFATRSPGIDRPMTAFPANRWKNEIYNI